MALIRGNRQVQLKDQEARDKSLPFQQGDKLRLAVIGSEKLKLGLFAITLSDGPFKVQEVGQLVFVGDWFQASGLIPLEGSPATELLVACGSEKGQPTEAEVYISLDRVKDNARSVGTTYKNEIHRVIFHGTLHLCGFKDKTPGDKGKMNLAEDKCLSRYLQKVPRGKS